MDLDSTYAPPINNACVPDVYNRLDAEVIERTRVANKQLNMKLLLEQKIIAKYKHESERVLLLERSRVRRELAQITHKLPAVLSVRDFDEKTSENSPRPVQVHRHRKKNYLTAKNEDPVCRRCYIHHLPTKKKFYQFPTLQPLPAIQDSKLNNTSGNHHHQNTITNYNSSNKHDATGNDVLVLINGPANDQADQLYPENMTKKSEDQIPSVEAFKFLEREKWGREIDLNRTLTPRLMPNEMWKNVVKNICRPCSTENEASSTDLSHAQASDILLRAKAERRRSGTSSRKQSLTAVDKTYDIAEPRPRKLSRGNSRLNLHRKTSVTNEGKLNGEPESLPRPTGMSHHPNNITFSDARRLSTAKVDSHP